jgi:hypothetical protein
MNHDHSNRGGPRNNALLPGGGGQGQGRVEGHRRSRMHRGGGHGDDDFVDTELRAQGEAIEVFPCPVLFLDGPPPWPGAWTQGDGGDGACAGQND